MIIKRKGKGVPEEPVQRKKKVKRSKSQTVTEIENGVQTDIGTEGDDQLEAKTKVQKKEKLKEDECLDPLGLKKKKKKKKKNKKKKAGSKLLKEAHSESFVNIESHPDSEPQEESGEHIKILKKKKKQVQCHSSSLENNPSGDVELSNRATGGPKENDFASKQSRQNTALNVGLGGEVTKKKGILSFSWEDSEHKLCEKVHKKPHKRISPETAFAGEDHGIAVTQNDGQSSVRRKKKKKKDKSDSFLPPTDNQEDISGVPNGPTALSDFRKRPRKNSQEITWTNTEEKDTTGNTGSVRETKRKKRRKDVCSLPCEGDWDCGHRAPDKQLPAQGAVESEEKELSGKKHRRNIKNNNEVIRKKKKVQKEEEETTYSKVAVNSASKSQKIMLLESNKKNKERGTKRAECVTGDGGDQVLHNSNHMCCDRKRKRRKKEVPQDFAEDPGSKANTQEIKREEEHVDDVTIVQEKKGNCDEVNIDKVRRQALQEEIDRESGKTKVFSPQAEWDTRFGQWSTAAFQSPEQQMKFLRLMGGLKKGPAPPPGPSATKALGRNGQDELQQNLEMQFHKATELKQHRGIGLGFQPAANKKAYIDKYASRSIKFD